ncbi:MAG: glycosyltransferase family 4 protein [Clostridia bacterium]|nr:glycosyltransferase family 4 protein [Clostridia bacterium]
MNILFFSQYYHPEQFLINDITPEIVKRGHKVTVVTGLPNYPSGVIEKGYKKIRHENVNGVDIIRCPIVPRGKNKIQLFINYFSFMFSAIRESKRINDDYDIVVSYQLTPIFQVYPAIRFAKRKNLKLLMYNLDLAPMSGSKFGENKAFLFSLYAKFSKWAMNNCDRIAVTSESFIEYNNRVNSVPPEKMIYLPQHAPDFLLNSEMQSEDNGIADFMFAGNIAGGTGLDTIVEAAAKLREDSVFRIHIVGDGSYLPALKEKVLSLGLSDYFIFHGRYPAAEMPEKYKLADALLITLREGQITVPAKLQTYMTTGKPVFGAMDGSGKDIINKTGCGICADAGDSDSLCRNMKDFINNPDAYKNCGEKGLVYFKQNFTLGIFIDRFMKILSEMK